MPLKCTLRRFNACTLNTRDIIGQPSKRSFQTYNKRKPLKKEERKTKTKSKRYSKKNYYNIIRKFMFINQNYIVFPDAYIKYMWSLTFNIYDNTSLMN